MLRRSSSHIAEAHPRLGDIRRLYFEELRIDHRREILFWVSIRTKYDFHTLTPYCLISLFIRKFCVVGLTSHISCCCCYCVAPFCSWNEQCDNFALLTRRASVGTEVCYVHTSSHFSTLYSLQINAKYFTVCFYALFVKVHVSTKFSVCLRTLTEAEQN